MAPQQIQKPPAPPAAPAAPTPNSIPRPKGGFPWRALIIAVVVFGLSVFLWAGMKFGYVPYLDAQISKADNQFNELSSSISADEQEQFVDFYSQLYNIDTLARSHTYPGVFFDFLETYTYPTVLLTGARIEVSDSQVRIEGVAANYSTLTDQIAMYRSHPSVISVSLDTSRTRDPSETSGTNFSLKLIFQPSYFVTR